MSQSGLQKHFRIFDNLISLIYEKMAVILIVITYQYTMNRELNPTVVE